MVEKVRSAGWLPSICEPLWSIGRRVAKRASVRTLGERILGKKSEVRRG